MHNIASWRHDNLSYGVLGIKLYTWLYNTPVVAIAGASGYSGDIHYWT